MGVEACLESSLTLAKSLLCCNFHSLEACPEACLEACLILAKCLFCSTFHSINGNFHSLEACPEACRILAKHVSPLLQFP